MLNDLQRALLLAMRQRDPGAWLRDRLAAGGPGVDGVDLAADERDCLLAACADGLRVTRLVVQKLRLQRLITGTPALGDELARDAAAFVAEFRAYVDAVPHGGVFPSEEAAAFAAWRQRRAAGG